MNTIIASIRASFGRFARDERGTQLVETAVWIGLITAAVVTVVSTLGTETTNALTAVSTALTKFQ